MPHPPATAAAARNDGLRTSAELLALVAFGAIVGGISIVPLGARVNGVLFACAIVAVGPMPFFCKRARIATNP